MRTLWQLVEVLCCFLFTLNFVTCCVGEDITTRYERLHSVLPPPYDGKVETGEYTCHVLAVVIFRSHGTIVFYFIGKPTGLSDAANSALLTLERCCGIASGASLTMDICSRLKVVISTKIYWVLAGILKCADWNN